MKPTFLLATLTSCVLLNTAFSAVLIENGTATTGTAVNLTTTGTLDWALWNYVSGASGGSRAPSNVKSGGPGIIGDISGVGGGQQGVSDAPIEISYTDGVSPISLTDQTQGFIAGSLDTIGRGVQLTITGDPTKLYQVDIWTSGFRAEGTLTASLSGATSIVDSYNILTSKESVRYSLFFQPDSISDLLTIQYILTGDNGSSAHVGIQSVTISVVPEPSSFALLGAGLAFIGFRRFRRKTTVA